MSTIQTTDDNHNIPDYWIQRLIDGIDADTGPDNYLRRSQIPAQKGIRKTLFQKRARKLLVDMPTQTGKTPLFIRLIQLLFLEEPTPRVLILTPYRRLIFQLQEEFKKFSSTFPEGHPVRNIGVWHALEKRLAQVMATTWPSANNLINNHRDGRFPNINPENYQLVFVDEAHLSQTDLRRNLLNQFSKAVIFAVSATPAYSKDKTLENDFEVAYRLSVNDAIKNEDITRFRSILLTSNTIDLTGVPIVEDDYNSAEVNRRLKQSSRIQDFISLYENWVDPVTGQKLFGKLGRINTTSIQRAEEYAEQLNRALGHLVPEGQKNCRSHPQRSISAGTESNLCTRTQWPNQNPNPNPYWRPRHQQS